MRRPCEKGKVIEYLASNDQTCSLIARRFVTQSEPTWPVVSRQVDANTAYDANKRLGPPQLYLVKRTIVGFQSRLIIANSEVDLPHLIEEPCANIAIG